MAKRARDSKTILFNVILTMIQAIIAGADAFSPFLTSQQLTLVLLFANVILVGGNMYLRLITNEPIRGL